MKEHPILFSTDMVKAILEGRKTQTRRIVKPQPDDDGLWNHTQRPMSVHPAYNMEGWWGTVDETGEDREYKCPYADIDDLNLLWVRETFCVVNEKPAYKADYSLVPTFLSSMTWKPSIHMPKSAARIWLEITDIRVERLQDISREDAKREGIEVIGKNVKSWTLFRNYSLPKNNVGLGLLSSIESFQSLWDSINGKKEKANWQSNPWVWAITFKVVSKTGNPNITKSSTQPITT